MFKVLKKFYVLITCLFARISQIVRYSLDYGLILVVDLRLVKDYFNQVQRSLGITQSDDLPGMLVFTSGSISSFFIR